MVLGSRMLQATAFLSDEVGGDVSELGKGFYQVWRQLSGLQKDLVQMLEGTSPGQVPSGITLTPCTSTEPHSTGMLWYRVCLESPQHCPWADGL